MEDGHAVALRRYQDKGWAAGETTKALLKAVTGAPPVGGIGSKVFHRELLSRHGETKEHRHAGWVTPAGKMVDLQRDGDFTMHQDTDYPGRVDKPGGIISEPDVHYNTVMGHGIGRMDVPRGEVGHYRTRPTKQQEGIIRGAVKAARTHPSVTKYKHEVHAMVEHPETGDVREVKLSDHKTADRMIAQMHEHFDHFERRGRGGSSLTAQFRRSLGKSFKGGLSYGKTIEEIAERHKVSVEKLVEALETGRKVEMEHTTDEDMALKIAMDHLVEHPDYYKHLKRMERKMEKARASEKRKYHERMSTLMREHKLHDLPLTHLKQRLSETSQAVAGTRTGTRRSWVDPQYHEALRYAVKTKRRERSTPLTVPIRRHTEQMDPITPETMREGRPYPGKKKSLAKGIGPEETGEVTYKVVVGNKNATIRHFGPEEIVPQGTCMKATFADWKPKKREERKQFKRSLAVFVED
jgi:hypothetical protein